MRNTALSSWEIRSYFPVSIARADPGPHQLRARKNSYLGWVESKGTSNVVSPGEPSVATPSRIQVTTSLLRSMDQAPGFAARLIFSRLPARTALKTGWSAGEVT